MRSASEAYAKIVYLEAFPERLERLLRRVRHATRSFLDKTAAPSIRVLQARVLHALEGRVDEHCVLPALRDDAMREKMTWMQSEVARAELRS